MAAGSVGGLLGAIAFIAVSSIGDLAGRLAGAAILGFAIGLMVALVEAACRRVWLEVSFGPRATHVVNLGAAPVLLGGNAAKCTILVPGAPQRALKFWEQDGQIFCLDVVAEKTYPVTPGHQQRLRDAQITVCSSGERSAIASPAVATKTQHDGPARVAVVEDPPPAPRPSRKPTPASAPQAARPAQAAPPAPSKPARPAPETPKAGAAVAGACPVCGHLAKGEPGKRHCASCYSVF
jgi:hypothetical protein